MIISCNTHKLHRVATGGLRAIIRGVVNVQADARKVGEYSPVGCGL